VGEKIPFRSSRRIKQKNNRLFAANKSNAKVITMGDLNDGPYNKSVKMALAKAIKTDVLPFGIYNPFEEMAKRFGDYSIPRFLGHFDQIMVSQSLVQQNFSLSIGKQGYTTNFFNTNVRPVQRIPKRHSEGSWFQ
jgi:hypothetical protein